VIAQVKRISCWYADRAPMSSRTNVLLQIWLFTPDLWFSSLASSDTVATSTGRAIKVMWRILSKSEHATIASQVGLEELQLSKNVHRLLVTDLKQNKDLLPEQSQYFQEWHVSLLHRMSR
jgi:hypothetical protein